jgi:hypothetical protein
VDSAVRIGEGDEELDTFGSILFPPVKVEDEAGVAGLMDLPDETSRQIQLLENEIYFLPVQRQLLLPV